MLIGSPVVVVPSADEARFLKVERMVYVAKCQIKPKQTILNQLCNKILTVHKTLT